MGRTKEDFRRAVITKRARANEANTPEELRAIVEELADLADEAIDRLPDDRLSGQTPPAMTTGQPPRPPDRM
jgi:hypothetical protein